jgi:carbon monoxide dehydrogenase subunit G
VRIDLHQDAAAPIGVVWDVLTRWEEQPRWMLDAKEVHVTSPHREGVGVELRCPTNLLGLTVQDTMRVTRWEPPNVLEVVHTGRIITGTGAFELSVAADGGTRIGWWEEVDPPLGALGELGANLFVAPIVRRIFRRSLRNLARTAEQAAGELSA